MCVPKSGDARRFKRAMFGGFKKTDVAVYVQKMHKTYRDEIEKRDAEITALKTECTALRNRPESVPVAAPVIQEPQEAAVGEEIKKIIAELTAESEKALQDLKAQEALNRRLMEQLSQKNDEALDAMQEASSLREQVSLLASTLRQLEVRHSMSAEYETLAYHRAEAIEREALYNAAQIRQSLEQLLSDAKEALLGVRAQTIQETSQIAQRANLFLELIANMPALFDAVTKKFDEVRPERTIAPAMQDDLD